MLKFSGCSRLISGRSEIQQYVVCRLLDHVPLDLARSPPTMCEGTRAIPRRRPRLEGENESDVAMHCSGRSELGAA
jgi:hypothetical protein